MIVHNCGYEGGVGAFLTFAAAYNIDLDAMANAALDSLDPGLRREAEGSYDWTIRQRRTTHGLARDTWVVCEAFKRAWRYAHPNIGTLWRDLGDNVRAAIRNPGTPFRVNDKLVVGKSGNWLRIQLPSGRFLCYADPQVADDDQISYMGLNQYTRKWQRIKTYGGKLVENATQAVARDDLFDDMPGVERAGYGIVLHVHDELITEAPDSDEFNVAGLSKLISTPHDWCPDLPLAAAGFEGYRYRKG